MRADKKGSRKFSLCPFAIYIDQDQLAHKLIKLFSDLNLHYVQVFTGTTQAIQNGDSMKISDKNGQYDSGVCVCACMFIVPLTPKVILTQDLTLKSRAKDRRIYFK